MSPLTHWKVWLFGILSWLVPFVAAFAFYDASGTLTIAQPLFKSLMVVIGGAVGVGLLVLAFRQTGASVAAGLTIGLLWLAINLALDFLVLVPMSGMTATDYLLDIGLRYLLLPIIALGMGAVAEGPG
ncbi:MAG: hypothetical protein JNK34_01925 [Tabrizicola sp.]|nr:hypothetical protein [Tabrizicola sp.]